MYKNKGQSSKFNNKILNFPTFFDDYIALYTPFCSPQPAWQSNEAFSIFLGRAEWPTWRGGGANP